ncbi:MAG: hypothetical protein LBG43_01325 [Treponema sp.]|jgi:hypothetical protein|nr:hypothetical protein [Treponema sp.]
MTLEQRNREALKKGLEEPQRENMPVKLAEFNKWFNVNNDEYEKEGDVAVDLLEGANINSILFK